MQRQENLSVSSKTSEFNLFDELNNLGVQKDIPKVKKFLKEINRGYYFEQHLFVEENKLDLFFGVPDYNMLQEILHFLMSTRGEIPYILSEVTFPLIDSYLNKWEAHLNMLIINESVTIEEKINQISTTLQIRILLHNYFCFFENNVIKQIDKFKDIESHIYKLAEATLETDDFQKIEPFLKINKKLLLSWKSKVDNEFFLNYLNSHYTIAAKLAFKQGQFAKAKKYAIKCNQICESYSNKVTIINNNLPNLFKGFVNLSYKNNEFYEAMFWLGVTFEAIDNIEVFLKKYENGQLPHISKRISVDTAGWRTILEKDKKYLNFVSSQCEIKLEQVNRQALEDFASSDENKFQIVWQTDSKFFISMPFELKYLKELTRKFNRYGVVCFLDEGSSTLHFHRLLDIKIDLFKQIIRDWSSEVRVQQRLLDMNNKAKEAASIAQSETIHSNTSPIATSNEETKVEKKKEKTDKTVPTLSRPEASASESISWGRNYPTYSSTKAGEVFKLYGLTAHHQYLFINQAFFSQLNRENPAAAENLVTICDRGKVINNSQGNKGIIIKGQNVKIKDASKPYRFFGTAVATTTHKNKTCRLIEINKWHRDPH